MEQNREIRGVPHIYGRSDIKIKWKRKNSSIMALGLTIAGGGEQRRRKKSNLPLTAFTKSIPDRSVTMEGKPLQFFREEKSEKHFCDFRIGND